LIRLYEVESTYTTSEKTYYVCLSSCSGYYFYDSNYNKYQCLSSCDSTDCVNCKFLSEIYIKGKQCYSSLADCGTSYYYTNTDATQSSSYTINICVSSCSSTSYPYIIGSQCVSLENCSDSYYINTDSNVCSTSISSVCTASDNNYYYYVDGSYKYCLSSCSGTYSYKKEISDNVYQCLSSCDDDDYISGTECLDSTECSFYYINSNNKKICLSSCSGTYKYQNSTNSPIQCVSSCTNYIEGNKCVDECSNNTYYEDSSGNKICIDKCTDSSTYIYSKKTYNSNDENDYIIQCLKSCDNSKYFYEYSSSDSQTYCVTSCTTKIYYTDSSTENRICVDDCSTEPYTKYYIKSDDSTQCVEDCETDYYYLKNSIYYCTDTCTSDDYLYSIETVNGKQCLTKCNSDSTCEVCVSGTTYYTYKYSCVSNCPDGFSPNENTYECEEKTGYCYYNNYTTQIALSEIENNQDSFASNYSTKYSSSNKYVEKYTHHKNAYILYIFESIDCFNSIDSEADIDLGNIPSTLKTSNGLSDTDEIIYLYLKIADNSSSTGYKTGWAFYDESGNKLNTSSIENSTSTVLVEITSDNGGNVSLAQYMASLGINIYNISDPFFNDICYPFTSEEGEDVSLTDRIRNYYQNVSICEEGCTFSSVNFSTLEATCRCKIGNSLLSSLNNDLTGEIFEFLENMNLEYFECWNEVWNLTTIKNSNGGYIITVMMGLQIICTIFFFCYGIDNIMSYLLRRIHTNKPNEEEDDKKNFSVLDLCF